MDKTQNSNSKLIDYEKNQESIVTVVCSAFD